MVMVMVIVMVMVRVRVRGNWSETAVSFEVTSAVLSPLLRRA